MSLKLGDKIFSHPQASIVRRLLGANLVLAVTVFILIAALGIYIFSQVKSFAEYNEIKLGDVIEKEATDVARLVSFKLSAFQNVSRLSLVTKRINRDYVSICDENILEDLITNSLKESNPSADSTAKEEFKNCIKFLWETVTFNEIIKGIRLTLRRANDLPSTNGVKSQSKYLQISFPFAGPEQGTHSQKLSKKTTIASSALLTRLCPGVSLVELDALGTGLMSHIKSFEQGKAQPDDKKAHIDFIGSANSGGYCQAVVPIYSYRSTENRMVCWAWLAIDVDAEYLSKLMRANITHKEELIASFRIGAVVAFIILALASLYFYRSAKTITEPLTLLTKLANSFVGETQQDFKNFAKKVDDIESPKQDEVWALRKNLSQMSLNVADTLDNLINSERLISLGILTAGLAHELKNPFTAIKMNLPLIVSFQEAILQALDKFDSLDLSPAIRRQIAEIKESLDIEMAQEGLESLLPDMIEAVGRMDQLLEDMVSLVGGQFAGEDEPKQTWDIVDGISSTVNLLHNSLKKGIQLETDFATPSLVYCQKKRTKQVLLNIVKNAIESIFQKNNVGDFQNVPKCDIQGRIKLVTKYKDDNLLVSVSDDGVGISPHKLSLVFDPFFTSKQSQGGQGLGLSLSRSIILDNEGKIWAESTEGEGATFFVLLPRGKE